MARFDSAASILDFNDAISSQRSCMPDRLLPLDTASLVAERYAAVFAQCKRCSTAGRRSAGRFWTEHRPLGARTPTGRAITGDEDRHQCQRYLDDRKRDALETSGTTT